MPPQTKRTSTATPAIATGEAKAIRRWCALLCLSASVAFLPGLKAPFYFDDLTSIEQNTSIRQLTPLSIPLSPPANTSVAGRPVVNVSLALNYALNERLGVDQRPDPAGPGKTIGYHVFNILIHICSTLLLFGVIRRTLRLVATREDSFSHVEVAGYCALLWTLHPVQSGTIYYVIARTELIVSLFFLLTVYSAMREWDSATTGTRRWWFAAAVAASALGMASKEVMVTAPIIVLLFDRAFRANSWAELFARRTRVLLYFALFSTELIVLAFLARSVRSSSVGFDLGMTWYAYLLTQCWAVVHYVRLILWPVGLTFDYGEIPVLGHESWVGLVLLSIVATGILIAWRHSRWRRLAFVGAWYFVLLAPSSSFVPIRTEVAAERRVYLASAAVVVLVVLAALAVQRRMGINKRAFRIGLMSIAVAFAGITALRDVTFRSAVELYRSVIATMPSNPRGYIGAGFALLARGPQHAEEASAMFRGAIEVDSLNFVAPLALGWSELTRGNPSAATQAFARTLRLRPETEDAKKGMARAFVNLSLPDSAASYVTLAGAPDTDLLWDLGALFVEQGRGSTAIPFLEKASSEPHSLGLALFSVALAQAGQTDRAVRTAERAVGAAGDTVNVFVLAGQAMISAGRQSLAKRYLQRAIILDPSSEIAKRLLAATPR